MSNHIYFGTVEALTEEKRLPIAAKQEQIYQQGLARPTDYLIGFSMHMTPMPSYSDFAKAMSLCGLRWNYLEPGLRHLPAEEVQRPADFVRIDNYSPFGNRPAKIFQLAYNLLCVADQIPSTGAGDYTEFVDLSRVLPPGRNSLRA